MDPFSFHYDFNDTYYPYDYVLENVTMIEEFQAYVIAWIVIWIGFPLTLLAIYALHSLIRDDNVTPIYVINLLISDLIQMVCLGIWASGRMLYMVSVPLLIYYFGVLASVGFMMCVSIERYLVVACPLWYRFRRNIRFSASVSFAVWIMCLVYFLVALLMPPLFQLIFPLIFFLLPFPLFIFFLARTLRALSSAKSVPSKEKRRIVGILVLVLLIYTVLFMPSVIQLLKIICRHQFHETKDSYYGLHLSFLQFSPLADLVLYVFMRKGAPDKLLACLCCCNVEKEEGQNSDLTRKTTVDVSSA